MFEFRFYEIWRESEYIERLINGVFTSFWLTVLGSVVGFAFAILLAVSRRSHLGVLSWPAAIYVEVVRNTPLIVQLFFVAFGLPLLFDYRWPFEWSALLALALNFSAYYSEIIRAGLANLDPGQRESASALGLTRPQCFALVVLPQSLCKVYPSLVSQFIFLFLTTGIISEIGIEELTWSGRFIADRTFRDFEVYLVLTLLYVLLAISFRGFFALMARRIFPWQNLAGGRT
ncbi:MAG: amino acid ABC transporter permease [Granulosicoccus sp.]|nr:amino acid ABC transporter permease [Granulosicoccus sp.]